MQRKTWYAAGRWTDLLGLKLRDEGGLTPAGIAGELLDLEMILQPPTTCRRLRPTLEQAAAMVRTIAEATPDYRKEYTARDGASAGGLSSPMT